MMQICARQLWRRTGRRSVHTFSASDPPPPPTSINHGKYQLYYWGWRESTKRVRSTESKWLRKLTGAYEVAALQFNPSGVKNTPQLMSIPDSVVPRRVSCGDNHMAIISDDHKLYVMGNGARGKLGLGNEDNHPNDPQLVHFDEPVVDVSCGPWHTLAVTESGKLFGWGYNGPTGLKGMVSSFNIGCYGLGVKSRGKILKPRRLRGAISDVVMKHVSCGEYHSLGLSVDRQLYIWGSGSHGRLGNGNANEKEPALSPVDKTFIHVSAGKEHSLAIDEDGQLWGWGKNDHGQIADNSAMEMYSMTDFPTLIKVPNEEFIQVSAGERHGLAVTKSGRVYMWGDKITAQPTRVAGPPDDGHFVSVSAGKSFSIGVTQTGELYSWGVNKQGQLGLGHLHSPIIAPTRLGEFGSRGPNGKVVYASAGATYVAVVVERH